MRSTILVKSDTTEIIRRTAQKLGCKTKDVETEIRFYWMDIDQMFTWNCGYGVYIDKFGHFLLFTKGIYKAAKQIEIQVRREMRMINYFNEINAPGKKANRLQRTQELLSRLILLTYSVELYKSEVLSTYPEKYKITYEGHYKAVIGRVEKLLKIPLAEFPIQVNNPIQKVFVQKLRKQGILQNPVIDNIKGRYKNSKVQ